jgi:hypothetical protein
MIRPHVFTFLCFTCDTGATAFATYAAAVFNRLFESSFLFVAPDT